MRQATHEWRKNLAGFEWLTETEMAEKEKWSEQLEKFYMSVLWLSNIFGTKCWVILLCLTFFLWWLPAPEVEN